jgi:hypothetical protein
MNLAKVFLIALVVLLPVAAAGQTGVRYKKLPAGIESSTQVNGRTRIVTAEQRLRELRARYRRGVLVDSKGREIRFWTPICRGVAMPGDEGVEEQKAKDAELRDLKKKYTVITVVCDPRTVM